VKPILPVVLVTAIVGETLVENIREFEQPHIEPELRVSTPTKHSFSASSGVRSGSEPLGILRSRLLYKNSARARLSKDKFALPDAFVKTAHELMRLRVMQPFERQIQFDCFRTNIELMGARTRGSHDFSNALPAIAKILGVPYVAKPGVFARLFQSSAARV
jgi:hypothetical protein